MASADFCTAVIPLYGTQSVPPSSGWNCLDTGQTSPGNAHLLSRLCPSHLRPCFLDRFWALEIYASLPSTSASMRFLFVGPAFCRSLPSDSASRRTPLRLWLTVPSIRPVRDFHPQVNAPCRAHIKKSQ